MLEPGRRYPIMRVYFNRHADHPKVWSVDNENQDNEVNTHTIMIKGMGQTVYTSKPVNEYTPVAWIEFYNVIYDQYNDGTVVLSS